ncbi:MAG: hypothetical protein HUU22_02175 [Phycisphaerae bacterium]|nr:hypothetical protein [Phycisphaerae bacterium]NUQ44822.1 hypothetical protein [Phycisphaerae bacterium]
MNRPHYRRHFLGAAGALSAAAVMCVLPIEASVTFDGERIAVSTGTADAMARTASKNRKGKKKKSTKTGDNPWRPRHDDGPSRINPKRKPAPPINPTTLPLDEQGRFLGLADVSAARRACASGGVSFVSFYDGTSICVLVCSTGAISCIDRLTSYAPNDAGGNDPQAVY